MIKSIIVNPEIAASVLKNKEDDLYILWLLAKKVDTNGSGIVSLKEIFNFAKIVLNIQSNYIYEKIEKGVGKYWRKPFGKYGNKNVCLLSPGKIIQRLKPDITRSKPVVVPLSYIQSSDKKTIRGLLISIVAGRYTDNKPLSMYSLIHNIGLSESTIRNALYDSKCLKIKSNFLILATDINRTSLAKLLQSDKEPWACKIVNNNGVFQLIKQQANSYDLDFYRLSLKSRPTELKKNDKRLFAILEPARYNNSNDLISFKTYQQ
jgi:hypothetical protein